MFYPYRNEIVEQNLTRALIILLKVINIELRNSLLCSIVGSDEPNRYSVDNLFEFTIENSTIAPKYSDFKRLVAISTTGEIEDDSDTDSDSIPDAQIRVDNGSTAVIMIESKVRTNTLSRDQLKRHSNKLDENLEDVLYVITWNKICTEISKLISNYNLSKTESFVMLEFLDFLKMYDYGTLERLTIPSFIKLQIPMMG
jgi:hypothetical protein